MLSEFPPLVAFLARLFAPGVAISHAASSTSHNSCTSRSNALSRNALLSFASACAPWCDASVRALLPREWGKTRKLGRVNLNLSGIGARRTEPSGFPGAVDRLHLPAHWRKRRETPSVVRGSTFACRKAIGSDTPVSANRRVIALCPEPSPCAGKLAAREESAITSPRPTGMHRALSSAPWKNLSGRGDRRSAHPRPTARSAAGTLALKKRNSGPRPVWPARRRPRSNSVDRTTRRKSTSGNYRRPRIRRRAGDSPLASKNMRF